MDNQEKRRQKRAAFSCDVKIHFVDDNTSVKATVKDISLVGVRCVVAGRLIKVGTKVNMELEIEGHIMECRGKIVWGLLMRGGMGNIHIFDIGIEFSDTSAADRYMISKIVND